jgi:hypothetical protein
MAAWVFVGAFSAVAVALLFGAFANLKKARVIEDVPTSKIRSAHQGYVELLGVARAHEGATAAAALTGEQCLWFDYKIERYQGGKNSDWTVVEKGSSDTLFALHDGTGECLVDPRGSDVIGAIRKRWTGYLRHPARTQETSLVGRLRRQRYRYTERRILAGQPLYAIGWFHTMHADNAQTQADNYKARLIAEWKQDYDALLARFDLNNDGNIDQAEWERARREAARQADSYVAEHYDANDISIIGKPENGQAYILSTSDPQDMTRRFRRNTAGMLAGGLMIAAFAAWFAFNRM